VVRVGLVMKRLASSARVDRGRKMGALLDSAHSKRAGVGAGDDSGAADVRERGGGGMRRWVGGGWRCEDVKEMMGLTGGLGSALSRLLT
jgi:hypothetical protein